MPRPRSDGGRSPWRVPSYIIRLIRALYAKGFSNKEILERIKGEYTTSITLRSVQNYTNEGRAAERMKTHGQYINIIRIWWDRGFSAREIADKLKLEHNVTIDPQTVYNYVGKRQK